MTVFAQLPLSEDDKIKVKLVDPDIIKVRLVLSQFITQYSHPSLGQRGHRPERLEQHSMEVQLGRQ
jgi:hypothetical protein